MKHTLRILVRMDLDPSSAVLEVEGCVTAEGCPSVTSVLARTLLLADCEEVLIDLRRAKHIEPAAADYLQRIDPRTIVEGGVPVPTRVGVLRPRVLPDCPLEAEQAGASR